MDCDLLIRLEHVRDFFEYFPNIFGYLFPIPVRAGNISIVIAFEWKSPSNIHQAM